jgi:hypothetical protein
MTILRLTLDISESIPRDLFLEGEGVALGARGRYGTIAREIGDTEGSLLGARDA